MLLNLIFNTIALQSVGGAVALLTTKEVTIIGVLLFLVVILLSAVIYLYKRLDKINETRLQDQKEFTKDMLIVTEKTSHTVEQVNEILKITHRDV